MRLKPQPTASHFWGHRGLPGLYPENTLPSFHAAADAGATWIETDVDITRDGTLLICHDDTLDRTTNATGPCWDVTGDDLRKLDAGAWFGGNFVGTPMPVLDEVVDLCIERGLNLNLELKPTPNGAQAARDLTAGACAELARLGSEHVIISSFNPMLLELCAQIAPTLPRACLFEPEGLSLGWKTICELAQATAIHPSDRLLTPQLVKQFHQAGLRVHAYTVNTPARANELIGWGVDAIFTDRVDRFITSN